MIPISNVIAEYSESTFVPQEPYGNEKNKKENMKIIEKSLEALGFNEHEIKEIITKSYI